MSPAQLEIQIIAALVAAACALPGAFLVLRGMSLDAEDGSLGDEAYTWTSNLSGTLGTGGELWVSDLPTGTHRITLTVTDSDGDTGTDTVSIFVGVSPNRVYLPLVLRSH